MNADALLKELNLALGLQYEEQDWGIINADPGRYSEFLRYLMQHKELANTQRHELAELIVASFNEKLLENEVTDVEMARFKGFLSDHREFGDLFRYWRSLEDSDEFPVAEMIRQVL